MPDHLTKWERSWWSRTWVECRDRIPFVPPTDAHVTGGTGRAGTGGRSSRIRRRGPHGPSGAPTSPGSTDVRGHDAGDLAGGTHHATHGGPPRPVRLVSPSVAAGPSGRHPRSPLGWTLRVGHRLGIDTQRAQDI